MCSECEMPDSLCDCERFKQRAENIYKCRMCGWEPNPKNIWMAGPLSQQLAVHEATHAQQ